MTINMVEQKLVKCGTCGVEFDLLHAKPCQHNKDGLGTMECPHCGGCICHLPLTKFRWASKSEQKFKFVFVLKSAFPVLEENRSQGEN